MNETLDILLAALLLIGALFILLGSIALVKLPDFFMRLHGPTKATTLGSGAILVASGIYFSGHVEGISLHEILITLFLFITAPVGAHLMAKAALHLKLKQVKRTRHLTPPKQPLMVRGDSAIAARHGLSARVIGQGGVLVSIWLLLSGGDLGALMIGVPAVAVAIFLIHSMPNTQGVSIRPWRLARFVPFFLKQSLRGGIDVAFRAFGAKPRLSCGVIPFETSLPESARVFFANVIGLLPGTLTIQIKGDSLLIHTLDHTKDVDQDLRILEAQVAHLFAICSPKS
ncbi:MAG: multicomponent K+:H+ antiporter subunit G [Verrucomicrobiales bacterium]|jgi:multicomponent K+:H+ antiporter subunit G